MKLLEESKVNRLTDNELRKIAEEHYKRRLPFQIKKKGLVALISGQLDEAEKLKVFKGLQPDEFDLHEVRQCYSLPLRGEVSKKPRGVSYNTFRLLTPTPSYVILTLSLSKWKDLGGKASVFQTRSSDESESLDSSLSLRMTD